MRRDRRTLGFTGKLGMLAGLIAFLCALIVIGETLVPGDPLELVEAPAVALLVLSVVFTFVAQRSYARALGEAVAAREELVRDNEHRKRMAEDLVRSEQSLKVVQELTQTGTWDIDCVTEEAMWSKGAWELIGLEEGEGEPSFELFLSCIHPDDRERVRREIGEAISEHRDYESEYRVCHRDGSVHWLFTRGIALYDDANKGTRLVGVDIDVTHRHAAEEERASLEQQLRQAQKLEAVGQLAGGVAHDFNNLLLALRGYGELALRATDRGEDASDEIAEMLAAADRATALTRQLLAFSRRQLLQPQVLNLNYVVTEIQKLLARLIGEDIALEVVVRGEAVWVNADRAQIEQVIANLAVNARDAMPNGGTLRLDVSTIDLDWHSSTIKPGRYALLAVSDTGCGMDTETAAQAFEPFFTTKEGTGTGLGLATVHGIVKQSEGHIWLYSEPDHGTTFKIYLPLVGEQAVRPLPELEPAEGGAETVLLVEDDNDVRSIVTQMLEGRGYRVIAAADGDEAIRIAGAGDELDLVLTDVVMTGMNGRETAERIRETHPDVAVLYMSGYTDDAVVRRGVMNAGTAFIQKPFSSEELARKIRDALDGRASLNGSAA